MSFPSLFSICLIETSLRPISKIGFDFYFVLIDFFKDNSVRIFRVIKEERPKSNGRSRYLIKCKVYIPLRMQFIGISVNIVNGNSYGTDVNSLNLTRMKQIILRKGTDFFKKTFERCEDTLHKRQNADHHQIICPSNLKLSRRNVMIH